MDIKSTEGLIIGQLVKITYLSYGKYMYWEYGVIIHIFDDKFTVLKKDNGILMQDFNIGEEELEFHEKSENDKVCISSLTQNGEPVVSKTNFFGKYLFKPDLLEV